eukprot:TRINITY_DN387_c0_g1_i5.p1 TRINITY_DN387_c0_g1~~TRINITY_DN387_c0_g1_i5.p1  ORF type:complete len:111 (+),score=6.04 TRINITY_DN387_c0_g1_i5:332-664(+)
MFFFSQSPGKFCVRQTIKSSSQFHTIIHFGELDPTSPDDRDSLVVSALDIFFSFISTLILGFSFQKIQDFFFFHFVHNWPPVDLCPRRNILGPVLCVDTCLLYTSPSPRD